MTEKRRDQGFTLVELLTVIIIIGILAAVAIPTFLAQREKGYRATVVSDARAIMTAQTARLADAGYTTDPGVLEANGYARSDGVEPPTVKLIGTAYVVCVKHEVLSEWLVLDGRTQRTSWAEDNADCA